MPCYQSVCAPKLQVVPLFLIILLLLFFPLAANALSTADNLLQHRAYDPITAMFGLPAAASRMQQGHELQLAVEYNNVFMGGVVPDREQLLLDGETSQLSLRYHVAVNRCWQFSLATTWLSHSAGHFDQPIDRWHQFFGLPDAGRDESPYDVLNYSYTAASGKVLSLQTAAQGWGDVQAAAQHSLGCKPDSAIARLGLKLPVGDINSFLGSGASDIFTDIQSPWWSYNKRSSFAASVGVMRPGKINALAQQRSLVGFGTLAMRYQFKPCVILLAQFDWHSALFDSQLAELGEFAVQASFGFRYITRDKSSVELTIAEDVFIDTAPDIVVRLAWTHAVGGTK